jgi:hypothetical protein
MSSGLHYGQGLFEGAKAHAMADGLVLVFPPIVLAAA